ncbi:murein DD-endopeptidase MepM/ murein hydrolase activator NlpD [Arthrobacter sp. CAN_A212]|uniref:M23 family metallopeptidase n=1 Tax=unclassified Arthrobacter TaxID=235627 RepID=UPI001A338595|nr:peptidoglycan DD-metalloendopeptidase family protein [Arthrobacter sp. CAN_C5]MBP2218186.1 murein DD-endopeptidase MepM/ murein hydrolase activator NlpD [Arthrobacter sp. CAN_C5]
MTPARPIADPKMLGLRKSATRTTLAVCIAVAAVCGSGYQSSFSGAPGQLVASAADRASASSTLPTGWVGRDLLALPVPAAQNFLTPVDPFRGFPSATGKAADEPDEFTVTSVQSDDPARPAPGTLMAPLALLSPSSPFGERINPITGEAGEFHYGLDFAAPCGTPVHAADAGTVRAVGWHPWGGGNRVEIDHGNGLITTYNHLEGISVKAGDTVAVSQVVAAIGSTGSSTGCHLHFETIRDGSHVDPEGWTLTPLGQATSFQTPAMTSYEPGESGASGPVPWVIAMPHEVSHNHAANQGSGNFGAGLVIGAAPSPGTPSASTPVPRTDTPAPAATSKPTRPSSAPSADPSAKPGPAKPVKAQPAPSASPPEPTLKPSPSTPDPAEAGKPDPTTKPTPIPKPSPSPSPAPTSEPSPAPTPEPSPTPDPEPTPDPDPEPTCDPEPAPDPEGAGGLEAGGESNLEPALVPIPSPQPTPAPEPVVEANPEDGAPEGEEPIDPASGCEAEDESGQSPHPEETATDSAAAGAADATEGPSNPAPESAPAAP